MAVLWALSTLTMRKAIIARLIDIRKAQQEYRTVHNGAYTANFDSLITFVKTAKLPFIMKVGSLTDDQLNNGMTEKKAMDLINKAKKTGTKLKKKAYRTSVVIQCG